MIRRWTEHHKITYLTPDGVGVWEADIPMVEITVEPNPYMRLSIEELDALLAEHDGGDGELCLCDQCMQVRAPLAAKRFVERLSKPEPEPPYFVKELMYLVDEPELIENTCLDCDGEGCPSCRS